MAYIDDTDRHTDRQQHRQTDNKPISLNNDIRKISDNERKKYWFVNYLMITDSYMNMIYLLNELHIVL